MKTIKFLPKKLQKLNYNKFNRKNIPVQENILKG